MATNVDGFYKYLEGRINAPGEFNARPFYSREGDTLFFYERDVQSYAKRLNPLLTLFLASADDSLIGFKIKGVQRLITRMDRLGIEKLIMHDDSIKLKVIIELALTPPSDDPSLDRYEDELGKYEDVEIERSELRAA